MEDDLSRQATESGISISKINLKQSRRDVRLLLQGTKREEKHSKIDIYSLYNPQQLLHLQDSCKIAGAPISSTIFLRKASPMSLTQLRACRNESISKILYEENEIHIIGCRCSRGKGRELDFRHPLYLKHRILSGSKNCFDIEVFRGCLRVIGSAK